MADFREMSSHARRVARRRYGRVVTKLLRHPRPADYPASVEAASKSRYADTEFGKLYFSHTGRQCHKLVHYFPIYDRHLLRLRDGFSEAGVRRPLRLLEVGVRHGGSLQIWRKFFGTEATIFGIDVDPNCAAIDDADLTIRIGSQSDAAFLRSVVSELGGIDVVIDDGSHQAEHQVRTFEVLFPLLSSGGVYLIEDTHTAYWPEFGGGLRYRGSFVEYSKNLVDGMHAWYLRRNRSQKRELSPSTISSISFYDSVVVIQKDDVGPPMVVKIGEPSF